jgi:hypothetical protein
MYQRETWLRKISGRQRDERLQNVNHSSEHVFQVWFQMEPSLPARHGAAITAVLRRGQSTSQFHDGMHHHGAWIRTLTWPWEAGIEENTYPGYVFVKAGWLRSCGAPET